MSELTDKLRELASRRHMDRGLDAVDDALREAASEIDRLREALATLTASASEFHEAVMPYLSDTTFDGDGVLANAEARLSVTALPLSRAALSPDNSTQKKEG